MSAKNISEFSKYSLSEVHFNAAVADLGFKEGGSNDPHGRAKFFETTPIFACHTLLPFEVDDQCSGLCLISGAVQSLVKE